ncbi:MAG: T9SS type A sorting domain-containing protein [Candidatus Eisenbacteria bacterium]|uniref:T9SS type A sorting domain-containing protein n=1 Tax=Eiseniibacteriota bacterium TaxID=2212470 RepID=A0A933WB16_UNCEI|nr:T9SS type A sorting domain-containing protein [Candidatus Eisenbacteria bacterium]
MRILRTWTMLALLAWPCLAHAAWSNDPTVNNPIGDGLFYSVVADLQVASDGAGGMYVAWSNILQAGTTGFDMRLQHVDARGLRVWSSSLAMLLPDDQWVPELLPDGTGGVFLVWIGDSAADRNLRMQRVAADGTLLWGASGKPLCLEPGQQYDYSLVSDGAGGFYCAWTDNTLGSDDIRAQHVGPSGELLWPAAGVAVCTHPDPQWQPEIATATDGGLLVTWVDWRNSSQYAGIGNLYAQRLDRQGQPLWTADGVSLQTGHTLRAEAIYADAENGAYVAWYDYVTGVGTRVRAQRLSATGTPRWTAGGIPVGTPNGSSLAMQATLDASQSLVVAWRDTAQAHTRVWVQKFDGLGAEQWTAGGKLVHSSVETRNIAPLVSDAAGIWLPLSTGLDGYRYLALKVGLDGTPFSNPPVTVCAAPGERGPYRCVTDGAGGMLLAWLDERSGGMEVYAQRVDRWGKLGAQPTLMQVIDAPADQGGYVQATWTKSPLDTPPSAGVNKYRFWREVPASGAAAFVSRGARLLQAGDDVPGGGAPALLQLTSASGSSEYWEYVGEMLADGRASYTASIATASDSVPGSNPLTRFMIEGRRGDGTQWWYSDPMSGASADNLAPASPASFFAVWSAGQSKLHWPRSTEADFKEYRIYSGDWPNFTPSAANLVAVVSDTGYTHARAHPIGYKIVAVDIHGNVSPARWTAPSGTTGVDDPLPVALAFAPVSPNPVRGEATLRFALPAGAHVTLAVYDAQGRRVRLLLDVTMPAGEHALRWDGDDDAGRALAAGLYFVRLEAGGRTFVRRCVLAP